MEAQLSTKLYSCHQSSSHQSCNQCSSEASEATEEEETPEEAAPVGGIEVTAAPVGGGVGTAEEALFTKGKASKTTKEAARRRGAL